MIGGMHGRGHMRGRGACVAGGICMAGGRGMHGRRNSHCSGQYTSYWNAFFLFDLFNLLFDLFRFLFHSSDVIRQLNKQFCNHIFGNRTVNL